MNYYQKIKCEICGREFEKITSSHLRKHSMTMLEYREQFPDALMVSESLKREFFCGEKNPFYGKHHIEESKQKDKEAHLGKHHTEETKQKMRDNHPDTFGKNNSMYGKEAWSKGKTKETDVRLDISGEKGSITKKEFFATEEGQKWQDEHNRGVNSSLFGKHPSEESKVKMSETHLGENNPNWQDGVSFEPYCIKFDDDLKERVREFFDRKCYVCGKTEQEQIEEMISNGKRPIKKLDVHHVNYDKMVCCNDVKPLFVPLCRSCHTKTQKDREYWEEFFTVSLNYLTDGECFLQKVITRKETSLKQQ